MPKKKTHSEFIEEIYKLVNKEEYILLDEYKRNTVPVSFLHLTCNQSFSVTPKNFLKGSRCTHCNGGVKYTFENVKQYVETNSNCLLLSSDYKNSTSLLDLKCSCGNNFSTSFINFKHENKKQCDECGLLIRGNGKRLKYEDVKSFIEVDMKQGYKLLTSDYTNNSTLLEIQCSEGHIFFKRYNDLQQYSGCPSCSCSKGEEKVRNYLLKNSFNFVEQFSFEDCVYVNKLKFDFAVFDEGSLKYLIEYDGEQHFKAIEFFGGEEGFKIIQTRDRIKNKYCEDNGINLIRIPFWDLQNHEQILNDNLRILRRN